MPLPPEKRCVAYKKDGSQCSLPSTYSDGKCCFHSETETAREAMRVGRLKGCSKPEKSPVVYSRDVPYIDDLRDIIKFLNRQLRRSLTGEIDRGQFETSIQGCAALAKCFELRDIRADLDQLEEKLLEIQNRMNGNKTEAVSELEGGHEQGED